MRIGLTVLKIEVTPRTNTTNGPVSLVSVLSPNNGLMAMKLEVNGFILNIVSAYAPQVNNSMEEKNDIWEDLDGLIESISK